MSITKEFRLDVTQLFYPEDLTPPGQTPFSLLEIKKAIIEQCKKQGLVIDADNFGIVEHIFDDDSAQTWIYTSELDDSEKFLDAVIAVGNVFYPSFSRDFEIVYSDVLVNEAFLVKEEK